MLEQDSQKNNKNHGRLHRIIHFIKVLPQNMLKVIYLLPFFLFGLWLLQMVYFPKVEFKQRVTIVKPIIDDVAFFRKMLETKPAAAKGYFHTPDEYVTQGEHYPPLCSNCHGSYPHSKEKKIRSMLNFHSGFIACAVCHAHEKMPENAKVSFSWVDRETGTITTQVEGEYGKYSAKIFPLKIHKNGLREIFQPVSAEAAQEFIRLKQHFTPDQIAEAKIKLHGNISQKPVNCSECHVKDGYMNFADLGFTPNRVRHLISTEVVGLVEKYKSFYMPNEIDFGKK